jgi:hypothetical protein
LKIKPREKNSVTYKYKPYSLQLYLKNGNILNRMTERRPQTEILNDSLKTAYTLFGKLSQKYGLPSDEGGFTFLKFIPVSEDTFDKVQGRYFGNLSNSVAIYFRKGKDAAQITLTKAIDGSVSLTQALLYVQQMTIRGNVLVQIQDTSVVPYIKTLNELLRKAEEICIEDKHRLQVKQNWLHSQGKRV